ncbi:MAG: MBL fold metallo-hydrolase [Bacteroidales bacterium]|nr:MBL fold metallo-hydrolase [Bacteroidales bacterium]
MKKTLISTFLFLFFSLYSFSFTLWQLPSQVNTIGNSYVIQTNKGHLIVIDGGTNNETEYLRGFIAALGNKVELWIASHPHDDHIQALTEIIKDPKGIEIKSICHSRFTKELIDGEGQWSKYAYEFYQVLDSCNINILEQDKPGYEFKIDDLHGKIMSVANPEILINPYNNSSMVFKLWDKKKSFTFLGDLGVEGGDKLMNSKYFKELDCDYLQMAHHGQQGVSKEFYMNMNFKACLWPTPSWVFNNDIGGGFNTHILKTIDTRNWIKEKGITKNYISFEGLVKIE